MIVDSVIKRAGWKGKDIGWARMRRRLKWYFFFFSFFFNKGIISSDFDAGIGRFVGFLNLFLNDCRIFYSTRMQKIQVSFFLFFSFF